TPALLRFERENLGIRRNADVGRGFVAAHGHATEQREAHIMKKSSSNKADRRKFLAGAAVAGAAAVTSGAGKAAILPSGQEPARVPAASRPPPGPAPGELRHK